MNQELFDLFEAMDDTPEVRENNIVKAPFSYPGGKQKSCGRINNILPYSDSYIEPFGGSGAVLLSRRPSKLEVYNDRFGGVTDFYRCIRDRDLCDRLIDRLELTVHSREEFVWCKGTWQNPEDPVERAARWYYMVQYSFGKQGRNFGRAVKAGCQFSGQVRERLKGFWPVHDRLKCVTIENQDWSAILKDFDNPNAVFYLDPPYLDAYRGIYKHEMTYDQHQAMLEAIMTMDGYVALSSYPNKLYDSYQWDDFQQWDHRESTTSLAYTDSNHKEDQQHVERGIVKEALYIKEGR